VEPRWGADTGAKGGVGEAAAAAAAEVAAVVAAVAAAAGGAVLGRAGGAFDALGPSGFAALDGGPSASRRSKLVRHTITCLLESLGLKI
jgi:hypothetical protein